MKIKTLVIAPYSGLKELVTQLAKEQHHLEVIVEHADLKEAIPIIRKYEQDDIQFIVSRGGTAKLIREYTSIPVIEIQVSGYDILRALMLVKDYRQQVELIGFPNICQGVVSVAHLLDMDIPYTTIHSQDEVDDAVQLAKNHGAQVLLGDTVTVRTADKHGLQGMMITSGKESVLDAFEQVIRINDILVPSQNDRIISIHTGDTTVSFGQMVAHSKIMQKTIEQATTYATAPKPIVICGEKGTGKRFLASCIHNVQELAGGLKEVIIPQGARLLEGEVDSLHSIQHSRTMVIKGLDNLTIKDQQVIFSVVKERLSYPSQQVIFIFTRHPWELIEQGTLHSDLLSLTNHILRVPSLEERKEDIEEYIKYFIGLYNSKFGKQVVGMRGEVMSYMLGRGWEENISELKKWMKELVLSAEGYYIEEAQLTQLDESSQPQRVQSPIDLSKTLNEIEKDIIQYVLQEEGMNQTKVAKRLGINRTTLWRKLNENK